MSASAPTAVAALAARLLSQELDVLAQDVRGWRVLVRADLNVPLSTPAADGSRAVADRERLDAALPALRALSAGGARTIVASHLGRPRPGHEPPAEMRRRDTLAPVAALLAAALGPEVFAGFAEDCTGPSALALVAGLRDGQARGLAVVPWRSPCRHRRCC